MARGAGTVANLVVGGKEEFNSWRFWDGTWWAMEG
jgi:hypothetical protein